MSKQMALCEAMRIGAAKRPKCEHRLFDNQGDTVSSCALGAAYEGYFGKIPKKKDQARAAYEQLLERFPFLGDPSPKIPGIPKVSLKTTIVLLNDDKMWSREKIADWLASLGY